MSRLHSKFQRYLVLYLHINQAKNSILKTIFRTLFLYGSKNVQESLYNVADFNFVQIWILHHRFYQGFEAILEITKTDIAESSLQWIRDVLDPAEYLSWSWSYTQKFSSANTIFWSFVLLFLCGPRRIILFSSNIWRLDPWYTVIHPDNQNAGISSDSCGERNGWSTWLHFTLGSSGSGKWPFQQIWNISVIFYTR